jgi:uncharacterized integral membrane protein
MGVGDLVALADAAHVGAAGLAVGSALRFLTVFEIVYMYRMRRFTTVTICAGCCLWTLPTMPYMKLTSQG